MAVPSTGERLVRAAWALVRRDGLDGLTLRRLAARVGVTAPAVYRHFAGKDALLQRLVDDANGVLGEYLELDPGLSGTDARLAASIGRYLDFARERPAEYEVLYESRGRRDLDVPPRGQRSRNFQTFRDRVAAASTDGALVPNDPSEVTVTIWALLHGLVALHRQGRWGGDERLFAAACAASLAQLFGGLKHRPGSPRSERR